MAGRMDRRLGNPTDHGFVVAEDSALCDEMAVENMVAESPTVESDGA